MGYVSLGYAVAFVPATVSWSADPKNPGIETGVYPQMGSKSDPDPLSYRPVFRKAGTTKVFTTLNEAITGVALPAPVYKKPDNPIMAAPSQSDQSAFALLKDIKGPVVTTGQEVFNKPGKPNYTLPVLLGAGVLAAIVALK